MFINTSIPINRRKLVDNNSLLKTKSNSSDHRKFKKIFISPLLKKKQFILYSYAFTTEFLCASMCLPVLAASVSLPVIKMFDWGSSVQIVKKWKVKETGSLSLHYNNICNIDTSLFCCFDVCIMSMLFIYINVNFLVMKLCKEV